MCKIKDQLIDRQVTFLERNQRKSRGVGFNNKWAHNEEWAHDQHRDNKNSLAWGMQYN